MPIGDQKLKAGLRFSETMSGYFLEDTSDCRLGWTAGRRRRNRIAFRARITIDNLQRFVDEAAHQACLEGHLDFGDLGTGLPFENGSFNLFVFDPAAAMRKMVYHFQFHSASGQPYLFHGEKEIHRDRSRLEVLRDMTTLFTRIYHGDSMEGRVAAAGILHFKNRSLPALMASQQALHAAGARERLGAHTQFLRFVTRELNAVYGTRSAQTNPL